MNRQLRSARSIGNVLSACQIAKRPELGRVNRRQIASLAGLAPHARGGRAEVRAALYLAAFIASKYDPEIKAEPKRMQEAGKPFKVVIIALARKLLTRLNAMIREDRDYVLKTP